MDSDKFFRIPEHQPSLFSDSGGMGRLQRALATLFPYPHAPHLGGNFRALDSQSAWMGEGI